MSGIGKPTERNAEQDQGRLLVFSMRSLQPAYSSVPVLELIVGGLSSQFAELLRRWCHIVQISMLRAFACLTRGRRRREIVCTIFRLYLDTGFLGPKCFPILSLFVLELCLPETFILLKSGFQF